jgi:uncharacterized RDD family membrane protein YckC
MSRRPSPPSAVAGAPANPHSLERRPRKVPSRAVILHHASSWRRLGAYVTDLLVLLIVQSSFVTIGALQLYLASNHARDYAPDGSLYAFAAIAAVPVPLWLLVTFITWSRAGRSVGAVAIGVRIVRRTGRPPGPLRGGLRLVAFGVEQVALGGAVAALVLRRYAPDVVPGWSLPASALALAFVLCAAGLVRLTPSRQALHDLVSGTYVVEDGSWTR